MHSRQRRRRESAEFRPSSDISIENEIASIERDLSEAERVPTTFELHEGSKSGSHSVIGNDDVTSENDSGVASSHNNRSDEKMLRIARNALRVQKENTSLKLFLHQQKHETACISAVRPHHFVSLP